MIDKTNKELDLGRSSILPQRKEIPDDYKWHLNDIYESSESWEKEFAVLKSRIPEIEKFRGTLTKSASHLRKFFNLRDELSLILEKLYVYANMKSHEDTSDSAAQGPANKISSLAVEFNAAMSFVSPEILSADNDTLEEFSKSDELSDYKFSLQELIRSKSHILSDAEEFILARAGNMAQTAENTFSMLTNADMKFPAIKDENGETTEMSEERAVAYLRSRNREVRKSAFDSLYTPYNEMKNTLGATFDGMLKCAGFSSVCRKYTSPLIQALDADNIPESVYSNLVDTIESNLEPMYRYMNIRKKVLGVDELHAYDLYVPLVDDPFGDISYSNAKEMMFKYLSPLGEKYLAQVRKGIDEGWIDVFPNHGKRSGAYSWGAYNTHPYIFMNYTNNLNDVFTLVHEMGHSMHSYYSHKNQPYPTSSYCIFTAEVASTTNEALLLSGLLNDTDDRKRKIYLLNRRLENIRTTVYRQTMFASFEREVHNREACGDDTTPDGLRQLWYDLNRKYYGPELVIDEPLKMEWARIPHFYTPFYVYQYATGFSAATALSHAILHNGMKARDKYIAFLKKGGSDFPIELLKEAGVDMSTTEPVTALTAQFAETVDELEKLL